MQRQRQKLKSGMFTKVGHLVLSDQTKLSIQSSLSLSLFLLSLRLETFSTFKVILQTFMYPTNVIKKPDLDSEAYY